MKAQFWKVSERLSWKLLNRWNFQEKINPKTKIFSLSSQTQSPQLIIRIQAAFTMHHKQKSSKNLPKCKSNKIFNPIEKLQFQLWQKEASSNSSRKKIVIDREKKSKQKIALKRFKSILEKKWWQTKSWSINVIFYSEKQQQRCLL